MHEYEHQLTIRVFGFEENQWHQSRQSGHHAASRVKWHVGRNRMDRHLPTVQWQLWSSFKVATSMTSLTKALQWVKFHCTWIPIKSPLNHVPLVCNHVPPGPCWQLSKVQGSHNPWSPKNERKNSDLGVSVSGWCPPIYGVTTLPTLAFASHKSKRGQSLYLGGTNFPT